MSRQRDILPLPNFEPFIFDCKTVSRSVCRRLTRKNHSIPWAHEGIHSLNRLGSGVSERPSGLGNIGAGGRTAMAHIGESYAALGNPPDSISPEGALSELLSNSGYYHDSRVDVIPYDKDRVSWPDKGAKPVPLAAHLGKADCEYLANWESSMLRDSQDYHHHVAQNRNCKP